MLYIYIIIHINVLYIYLIYVRFGMLASVSVVMKEAMLPHLQAIIAKMLESLQSEEGVKVSHTHFYY